MQLHELVDRLADRRDIAKITVAQYRRAVRCFSESLGRPATLQDLTADQVNRWLRAVGESKAPATVLGRKRGITAIWNFASDDGLVGHYESRKLRRIRVDMQPIQPWTVEQLRTLLIAADRVQGRLNCGIPASLYLRAIVRFAFETGFRPSDLRLLTWSAVDFGPRLVSITQHKTGKPHVAAITEATVDDLRRLHQAAPDQRLVFPLSKSSVRRWERALWHEAAKLGFDRRPGQAIGYTRKSHATEVARDRGLDAAAASLGHVSGTSVAKRFYVAASAIQKPPVAPVLDEHERSDPQRTRPRGSVGRPASRPAAARSRKPTRSNSQ